MAAKVFVWVQLGLYSIYPGITPKILNRRHQCVKNQNEIKEKKELEKEQINYIETILSQKEILKMERENIIEHARQEFNKKYGFFVQLKRIRGVWSVTINGKVKRLKSL